MQHRAVIHLRCKPRRQFTKWLTS